MIYAVFTCRTESHPEDFTVMMEVPEPHFNAIKKNIKMHLPLCDALKQRYPDFKSIKLLDFFKISRPLTEQELVAAMEIN